MNRRLRDYSRQLPFYPPKHLLHLNFFEGVSDRNLVAHFAARMPKVFSLNGFNLSIGGQGGQASRVLEMRSFSENIPGFSSLLRKRGRKPEMAVKELVCGMLATGAFLERKTRKLVPAEWHVKALSRLASGGRRTRYFIGSTKIVGFEPVLEKLREFLHDPNAIARRVSVDLAAEQMEMKPGYSKGAAARARSTKSHRRRPKIR